jgi:hypothetical protein
MSDIRTAGAEATGAALEMLLCGAEQRVFDDSRWAMLIEGRMALCHSGRCCNDEFGDCVGAGELHPGRLSEKKPLNSQPGPAAAGADCGWEEDVSGGCLENLDLFRQRQRVHLRALARKLTSESTESTALQSKETLSHWTHAIEVAPWSRGQWKPAVLRSPLNLLLQ